MFQLPNEFYTIMSQAWPMITIFAVVLSTVRIFYLLEHNERFVLYKEFFTLAFVIYILLLFGLVTNTDVQSFSNNFIPFKEILRYKVQSNQFMWNVIGNIVIFIPFGYFISLYLSSKKINKPFLITAITSLTIECVQMFIGRSFDIDDILLNCIGGCVGFLLYIGISAIHRHLPKFLQRDLVYNLLTVILIIFIIIYILRLCGVEIL